MALTSFYSYDQIPSYSTLAKFTTKLSGKCCRSFCYYSSFGYCLWLLVFS